jgi:hypothetical protein
MQNQNESLAFTADLQSSENNDYRKNSDILPKIETKENTFRISEKLQIKDDKSYKTGKWSIEEHQKFLEACNIHGNNWFKVKFC